MVSDVLKLPIAKQLDQWAVIGDEHQVGASEEEEPGLLRHHATARASPSTGA